MRKGLLLRRSGGRHPIHDGAAAGAIQFNSILGATILGAPPRPKGLPAASDALLRQHAEAADGGRRRDAPRADEPTDLNPGGWHPRRVARSQRCGLQRRQARGLEGRQARGLRGALERRERLLPRVLV